MAAVVATVAAGPSSCLGVGLSQNSVARLRVSCHLFGKNAADSLSKDSALNRLLKFKNHTSRLWQKTMPGHLCRSFFEELLIPIEGGEAEVAEVTSGPLRTLILDNYDSYTYNLFQLIAVINGEAPVVLKNDEISWEDLHSLLYKDRAFHNVVISPGPGSPTRAADIGVCMPLLKGCPDIPILGVCMGHQALGFAHGAKVMHAAEPVHGRLSEVLHNGHPLFNEIPSGFGSGFKVVRYHSLVLDCTSLPEDLIPIAWTVTPDTSTHVEQVNRKDVKSGRRLSPDTVVGQISKCKMTTNGCVSRKGLRLIDSEDADIACKQKTNSSNIEGTAEIGGFCNKEKDHLDQSNTSTDTMPDRVLMGVSHRSWPHHGVQFHPESVATAYGREILENFADITRKHWRKHSWRPDYTVSKRLPVIGGKRLNSKKQESMSGSRWTLDHLQSTIRGLNGYQISENQALKISAKEPPSYFLEGTESKSNINGVEKGHFMKLRVSHTKLPGRARMVGGSSSLFCELFGSGSAEDTFWLDSSNRDEGRARFSFMGGRGGDMWRRLTYNIVDNIGVVKVEDAAGHCEEEVLKNGFLDYLNDQLQLYSCRKEDCEPLPFEFNGGFVGYLGYEMKVECGVRLNRHQSPFPDSSFFLADRLVVVDHSNEDVYVLALHRDLCPHQQTLKERAESIDDKVHPNDLDNRLRTGLSGRYEGKGHTAKAGAEAWISETVEKILGMAAIDENEFLRRRLSTCFASSSGKDDTSSTFISNRTRMEYLQDVAKCLDYIRDGESYEICLTTQLRKKLKSQKPLRLYLALREINPAPYAAWLQFGASGPSICCSSPERFLRLDNSGTLEAKPIKGTLPRGSSPQEDEMLRSQLQRSEKDRAENLMIVDLLRNDLGRVCVPGSVNVPSLMKVETYSTVHTMVSTVRGKKKEEVTPIDCVKAAFPGGSMTGAPKLRTLEILDSLEGSARGIYSGTIGFFSFNNSFDLNIVIRTVIICNGEASIGAGGAIVSLSEPEAEYAEMLLKTKASIRAVSSFENDIEPSTNHKHKGCPLPF